ncbi:hypothetical protein J7E79_00350 [Bacillus sp. ISL-40]|uniref:hypothetical protein n=1 Tax=unclassified Bacillus (in: firmicutes) TaxID=185979 RepID=UPI001BED12F5|nr:MULTISPECIES: hypothetical protein [unclassified Bacillus (in: firmicutes)]MBT2695898.1 hypothetical protein [Bacillus sp. ISL-40]MBT2739746.1 hypothetical protein [Bacillus sp. ISL-77]
MNRGSADSLDSLIKETTESFDKCHQLFSEDASYLADMFKLHGENFEQAFLAYQEERIPLATKVQKSARLWGEIIHAKDPVSILLRNTLLEKKEAKEFEMIDWLYGYKKLPAKI